MPKTRVLMAVAAAGVLVAMTGCSNEDEAPLRASKADTTEKKQQKSEPIPKATPEKTTEPAPKELSGAVSEAILAVDDVGNGVEEQDREKSLDTVTNDICAKQWPMNEERTAREQVFYWEGDVGEVVVSNEIVAYKDGQGPEALDEIRQAVSECGDWRHRQGEITGVSEADVPEGALEDSFAWEATDERTAGDTTYSYVAVYQLRDDLLSGLYLWAPSTDEAYDLAAELVPKAAERLQSAVG